VSGFIRPLQGIVTLGVSREAPQRLLPDIKKLQAAAPDRALFIASPALQGLVTLMLVVATLMGREHTEFAGTMQLLTWCLILCELAVIDLLYMSVRGVRGARAVQRLGLLLPRPACIPLITRTLDVLLQPPRTLSTVTA
jgi:hypothetical protein